ncbi:MAG: hypothetical protein AAF358_00805 [Pseudomonadota bacterium]
MFQRLREKLIDQDWVGVSVELLIVVVGIFLGLQASAWYEDRRELALSDEYLERLRTEFTEIKAEIDGAIDTHQKIIDGLQRLQVVLNSGPMSDADIAAIEFGLMNVLNMDTGGGVSATYQEILTSGQLRLISNKQLISALAEYQEHVDNAKHFFADFRRMQMQYERDFNRQLTFGEPERFEPRGFQVPFVVDYDMEAMRNDADFRQALVRMMTFQIYFQAAHWQTARAAQVVSAELDNP